MESFFPPERLAPLRGFYETRIDGSYYVDTFAVGEKFRRRGIGTALLNGALNRARAGGYRSISLIVLAANGGARAFYGKNGFERVREIPLGPMPGVAYEAGALLMEASL